MKAFEIIIGNMAHLSIGVLVVCFLYVAVGCRHQLKPTILLTCSPMNDTLRYMNKELRKSKRFDVPFYDYLLLQFDEPTMNGGMNIDIISRVYTIINIAVRIHTVRAKYAFKVSIHTFIIDFCNVIYSIGNLFL